MQPIRESSFVDNQVAHRLTWWESLEDAINYKKHHDTALNVGGINHDSSLYICKDGTYCVVFALKV